MPQIPYSPVPSIASSDTALPKPNINTPVGAFGGEVARAISQLGAVTERAGNELFSRAVALQQLQNQTEATEADANYMIGAGELHAKFNALEGRERVQAFPQYSKDLQDLRQKMRGSLRNPMVQKMFDSSSLSTMGRSIFNGAGAAATANKDWAHTTVNARSDLLTKGTYDNPNDEGAFRDAISDIKQTAVSKAALTPGGASPERVELITRQGISTVASNRILGMARNQPYQASQLLKKYKDEGLLFGKDYETVSNKVQSLTQTVGTDTIANQVLEKYIEPNGTYTKSASEMQAEAMKIATDAYPDDPKMGTAAKAAFDRNYNQHQWAKQQDERAVTQQMNAYIVKGVQSTEMLPPDLVKRMTPAQIRNFPAAANTYHRSIDAQTNREAYEKYLGLYNNDNGKFMEMNFMAEPGLSKSDRDSFIKLQRQTNANGDPRVWKAMSWLRGYAPQTLNDLGIIGKSKDETTANQFVGALHSAIQAWQENTGKPPNETQLTKEIFPNLVMRVTNPDSWFGFQSELFKAGLPKGVKELAEKDAGKPLTDEEAKREYLRTQFNQLFGQRKKDQGRVP